MKKLYLILISLFLLSGCGGKIDKTPEPTPPGVAENDTTVTGTVKDFFPFKADTMYEYEGDMELANSTAYFNYIKDNTAQRILTAGPLKSTEVLKFEGGALRLVYGDSKYPFYEDITDSVANIDLIILKEPLEKGASWESGDGSRTEITDVNVLVKTPAGEFNTILVTRTIPDGRKFLDYYAKGVGLVKSEFPTSEGTIAESLLTSISEDVGVGIEVDFYMPNVVQTDFQVEKRPIYMRTNVDYISQFESEFKKITSDETIQLLTENSKINFINLDRAADTAFIDISKEFSTESDVGDGIETDILHGITNTTGNFYGVSKVVITIDGKPFENGSIKMESGEGFPVQSYEE